jgi:pantothenate kinase
MRITGLMSLRQHHGNTIVASFVAGMAAASLLFLVSSSARSIMRDEEEAEVDDNDDQPNSNGEARLRKIRGSNEGSLTIAVKNPAQQQTPTTATISSAALFPNIPGKHRWPWESRNKSSMRSGSMTDSSCRSEISISPPVSRDSSGMTSTAEDPENPAKRSKSAVHNHHPHHPKSKQGNLCIGSIFGLEVGGTLAKLVYSEAEDLNLPVTSSTSTAYVSSSSQSPSEQQQQQQKLDLLKKRASMTKVPPSSSKSPCSRKDWKPHMVATQEHYQHLHFPRTNSVPTKLTGLGGGDHHYYESSSKDSSATTISSPIRTRLPSSFHMELLEHLDHSSNNDSTEAKRNKQYLRKEALSRFYAVAKTLAAEHNDNVSFYNTELGGTFHFIQFETKHMNDAMELIRHYNLHMNIQEMGGTGGGAHKYAELFLQELAIEMKKLNELDSLVAGMQFVLNTVVGECYTYRPPDDQTKVDDWSQKVVHRHEQEEINERSAQQLYPYLVVIIGTGVSVLRVDGPRQYERVSGSTIGGGTFFGLIRLLTDADKFDDGRCFVFSQQ